MLHVWENHSKTGKFKWLIFVSEKIVFAKTRSAMEKGSSPTRFAGPLLIASARDILTGVCIFPVNVRSGVIQ